MIQAGPGGVFAPRSVRLTIGEAVPQIDDKAAAHVYAARRADLARISLEVRTERIGDLSPALLDKGSLPGCFVCRAYIAVIPSRYL